MAFASLRAFRSMADFDFATERCAAQASFAGPAQANGRIATARCGCHDSRKKIESGPGIGRPANVQYRSYDSAPERRLQRDGCLMWRAQSEEIIHVQSEARSTHAAELATHRH